MKLLDHDCSQDILEIGPECNEQFLDWQKAPELERLSIPLCGFSTLQGHYRVGRSNPIANTIFYSVDGAIELTTLSGKQTVEKRQIIILPAHQPFLIELESPSWTMTWFDLEDGPRWNNLCSEREPVEYCESGRQIFHALAVIYYERQTELRTPILNYLERHLQETLKSPCSQNSDAHRLDQLFRDIEKRLHYPWTIDEMAQLIHYSAPHLHRICQNRFGRSPLQHIIYLRMERAKHLLKSTGWPITHVAEQVGYHDLFSFSKRFKKSVGQAPAAYRKSFN